MMHKQTIGLVAVVLWGIVLASHPALASPPVELNLGYIRIAECAPIYVAIKKGYFEAEGLRVKLVDLPGGRSILPQVATGVLAVGFTNVVSLAKTYPKFHCRSIAGSSIEDRKHVNHGLLLRPGVELAAVPRPLRVAVNTRDNIEELAFRRWAAKQHLNNQEFTFAELPFPQMGLSLSTGAVDVLSTVEPYLTQLTAAKQAVVLSNQYTAIADHTPVATWAICGDSLSHEVIQKFRRAHDKSLTFIAGHESEAREIIGQYTTIDKHTLAVMGLPAFEPRLSPVALQPILDAMASLGWLPEGVTAANLIFPDLK